MKKIYYLSTCDTCKRILKEIDAPDSYTLQDIKKEPLTEEQLDDLKKLSGSYEKLFNKRARLYKERDLKNKELTKDDYKNLLLEHYTFLKRPVIVNENDIFIGNSKSTVEAAKKSLHE
ncbi:arsenate reductase [Salinimicrobium catena]|uniref:Arsenate reductase n=1 Tax=Salinimicrobium catena TaxID=390640 RepID=A0A1H5J408_9FLAO|nr:ArsC/Spx/MgsR family protein [Salinimicrobium catena]SDK83858.1 arsenate reductase [Salinimicrobium catena]SEE47219.1 arsenate reductase [Salinimicrobium catena]